MPLKSIFLKKKINVFKMILDINHGGISNSLYKIGYYEKFFLMRVYIIQLTKPIEVTKNLIDISLKSKFFSPKNIT